MSEPQARQRSKARCLRLRSIDLFGALRALAKILMVMKETNIDALCAKIEQGAPLERVEAIAVAAILRHYARLLTKPGRPRKWSDPRQKQLHENNKRRGKLCACERCAAGHI